MKVIIVILIIIAGTIALIGLYFAVQVLIYTILRNRIDKRIKKLENMTDEEYDNLKKKGR